MKKVLILFNYRQNKLYDNSVLVKSLASHVGAQVEFYQGAIKELTVRADSGGLVIWDEMNGRDLADYDLVIFRLWYQNPEKAAAAARYLQQHKIRFFDSDVAEADHISKLHELTVLVSAGLPIIDTLLASPQRLLTAMREQALPVPWVMKDIYGRKGQLNFLIRDEQDLARVLEEHPKIIFMAQPYIPNKGDLRLFVIGGKVHFAIERKRKTDVTHLNNISQGARSRFIELGELPDECKRLAEAASIALKREIAGVDLLIEEESGRVLILEVNSQPDLVSSFEAEKIKSLADFIKAQVERIEK